MKHEGHVTENLEKQSQSVIRNWSIYLILQNKKLIKKFCEKCSLETNSKLLLTL